MFVSNSSASWIVTSSMWCQREKIPCEFKRQFVLVSLEMPLKRIHRKVIEHSSTPKSFTFIHPVLSSIDSLNGKFLKLIFSLSFFINNLYFQGRLSRVSSNNQGIHARSDNNRSQMVGGVCTIVFPLLRSNKAQQV